MSFFAYINQHQLKYFRACVKIVGCYKKNGFLVRVLPIIVSPLQVIRLRNVYLELRV